MIGTTAKRVAMCSGNLVRIGLAVIASCTIAGCQQRQDAAGQVVIYTSVDEPVARPILQEFTRRTGIKVVLQGDAEANKSIGLAERLLAEKNNPQADVWWGNEIFHTINLADEVALAAYDSPSARDIPGAFKDPKGRWTGMGLRIRVMGVYEGIPTAPMITGLHDLTRPEFKGKIAMARPTAGTTQGHVAALYVLWGKDKFEKYFADLRSNDVVLLGGNSQVAESVGKGQFWLGLTDNDDVAAARRNGLKVKMLLPDQDSVGTLAIPCTVGLVAGAKRSQQARKLIDYLLSEEVEKMLIEAQFAAASVRDQKQVKTMPVDYAQVARMMAQTSARAMEILQRK